MLKFSVIICTYNRAEELRVSSEAALAVEYPQTRWELVIVDNNSTDGTDELVRSLCDEHPDVVRSVRESRLGLSFARNAGIAAARGEIVVFLDDDAVPKPGWLEAYEEVFTDASILGAGGPIEPVFTSPRPEWFGDEFLAYVGKFYKGEDVVPLRYNEYPRGGNMALRRRVFDDLSGFDPKFGVRGPSLAACEETELFLRIERSGGKLAYAPRARVQHRVSADHLSPEWLLRRYYAQGRSEAMLEWRHGGLAALAIGLRRIWAWRQATRLQRKESKEVLDHQCVRSTLRGYLLGGIVAVFTLPRYKPQNSELSVAPWRPWTG